MKQPLDPIPEDEHCCETTTLVPAIPMAESNMQLHYLSNLKAFLTALVILHHTAIAYGGAGQLAYRSPSNPSGSEPVLIAFNAFNQSFFMALFFFIAGFLSRRGLQRRVDANGPHGAVVFVRDRLWRLGFPTALYSILGPAVCVIIIAAGRGNDVRWSDAWAEICSLRGVRGPVWFCALLLIFDTLLASIWTIERWRSYTSISSVPTTVDPVVGSNTRVPQSNISGAVLLASLSLLSLFDFLWRLVFPVGRIFTPLNLNLGYLPQYISAYVFGATTLHLMSAVPSSRTLLILGLVTAASGTVLAHNMTIHSASEIDQTAGGYNVPATTYAIWNSFTGYLVGSGLLHLFHSRISKPCKALTDLAYDAFLLHIPVSTAVEVAFEDWGAGPIARTVAIGAANVVATWAMAWLFSVTLQTLRACAASGKSSAANCPARRRRTLSKGERGIEILEGLDDVKS